MVDATFGAFDEAPRDKRTEPEIWWRLREPNPGPFACKAGKIFRVPTCP